MLIEEAGIIKQEWEGFDNFFGVSGTTHWERIKGDCGEPNPNKDLTYNQKGKWLKSGRQSDEPIVAGTIRTLKPCAAKGLYFDKSF